jgi:hypothetical protein
MTTIDPPSGLDEMSDATPISVTDERKIGLSQHRFFCECGNIITAPSASAYIEAGGIRHVWVCGSCGQSFETAIAPVNDAGSCGLAAPWGSLDGNTGARAGIHRSPPCNGAEAKSTWKSASQRRLKRSQSW